MVMTNITLSDVEYNDIDDNVIEIFTSISMVLVYKHQDKQV